MTKLENKSDLHIDKIDKMDNQLIDVQSIYEDIRDRIYEARRKIYKRIDNSATEINWYVGKIASGLLGDKKRAEYGEQVINALSAKLQAEFGSGFAPVSIRRMRRFYEYFPIWSTVPTKLTWSHFQELIRIVRKEERDFYTQESINSSY